MGSSGRKTPVDDQWFRLGQALGCLSQLLLLFVVEMSVLIYLVCMVLYMMVDPIFPIDP